MLVLGVLLFLLGLACLFISIFVLLIRAIMKKKNSAKFTVISLAAVIAGIVIICVSPEIPYETADAEETTGHTEETLYAEENDDLAATETDESLEGNDDLAAAETDESLEGNDDLAATETDESLKGNDDLAAAETDESLEENAGGFYIDEYGEAVAVDGIMPEQDYFDDSEYDEISDAAKKILNIEDVQKCLFPISEYPYQNTKKAKKLMKTYDAAMKADIEDFVYVEEVSEGGLLTSKKIYYKKTLDESKADYKYYGKLNKDSKADGTGILLSMWDDDTLDFYNSEELEGYLGGYLVAVSYIGEFDNGYKNGYGIEYRVDLEERSVTVQYEGAFKKGEYEGEGAVYRQSRVIENYPDVEDELYWLVRVGELKYEGIDFSEDSTMIDKDTYDYLFPDMNGNILITYPIIASYISYEGGYKDGGRDGKGVEYGEGWDSEQECIVNYKSYEGKFKNGKYNGQGTSYFSNGKIRYKGEYKNGDYNGKGTLYDEQGNVVHKGKFKKGDVE